MKIVSKRRTGDNDALTVTPFGEAQLSNCEREQIHLAQSIQPHGALLVVTEPEQMVVQASANAGAFLGLDRPVIGAVLADLVPGLAKSIQPHLRDPLDRIPLAVRCELSGTTFDALLHRPPNEGLVIEIEHAGPPFALPADLEKALQTILGGASLRGLCDETARIFKKATGYDRVMVYRFDEEGHGEVYSEEREPALEPYLGNRYPASDIPQIARRLYERNRVRVLVDVEYQPVPLVPRFSPITDGDLDMSLCFLRSMSPIHIQYLKNMGVAATLVVSVMVGGKLWGLISCHHYLPRYVPYETRAICELLAEVFGTRIAALESFGQFQSEISVRRLEQQMIEAISREGDWRQALFDRSQTLLDPVGATGAALVFENQVLSVGEVPGTQEIREIAGWLDQQPRASIYATASLGIDAPAFAPLTGVASGLLAAPISRAAGEYLFWFRPERVRSVTWAGDPLKPFVIGDDPADLSPRRSFAQWHEIVKGTSDAWTAADITAARLIGDTVIDVVLQFRSVRMLIAKHQLDSVTDQVQAADQPAIIADAKGQILLVNSAFQCLLPGSRLPPRSMDDLPILFTNPIEMRRRLRDLKRRYRLWRDEILLERDHGEPLPLLVRADPVFSAPGQVLGFVLLFTDLTERKAAKAARRRFQEGIYDRHRMISLRLDAKTDQVYRAMMAPIVENAQLAALEITEGVDSSEMADMLEGVRSSVKRSAEVLEHLAWYAMCAADEDPQ
ncbi:MAG: GAF domain-containing protein [Xanthobacteraceae bacterium]